MGNGEGTTGKYTPEASAKGGDMTEGQLIPLDDAAKKLGYTASGLRKIVRRTRQGKSGIQFFQVGNGPIRFKPEWLDDFVTANSVAPQRPMPTLKTVKNCKPQQGHQHAKPGTLSEYFP